MVTSDGSSWALRFSWIYLGAKRCFCFSFVISWYNIEGYRNRDCASKRWLISRVSNAARAKPQVSAGALFFRVSFVYTERELCVEKAETFLMQALSIVRVDSSPFSAPRQRRLYLALYIAHVCPIGGIRRDDVCCVEWGDGGSLRVGRIFTYWCDVCPPD